MRAFALAAVLMAGMLAGCTTADDLGSDNDGTGYPETAPTVDGTALASDLETFVSTYPDRIGNSPRHVASRDALATTLTDAGLEVWRHPFSENGLDQENIVGIKWGDDPHHWVVVGGHFDSYLTACHRSGTCESGINQGAYDNGAGTMMTVHLAKAWAELGTRYTLVFTLFDGEERGLQGSKAFVRDITTGEHPYGPVELVGMMNLDMIGLNWPATGAPIMVMGDKAMQARVLAAGEAVGVPPEYVSDDPVLGGSSDHRPFMDAGIEAGMVWSDFDRIGAPAGLPFSTPAGVYPHWHLVDRWETMLSMAGTEEHLAAGMGTAADVVSHVLWQMAVVEPLDLTHEH